MLQKNKVYRKHVYEKDIEESRRKSRESYYKYKETLSENKKKKRQENPEEIRTQDKIYRDKYREKHIESAKSKILCEVCGIEHRKDALSKHVKTNRHQTLLLELNVNSLMV